MPGLTETACAHLQAPIKRVTSYGIHFPYFQVERFYMPEADAILGAALETTQYSFAGLTLNSRGYPQDSIGSFVSEPHDGGDRSTNH
ncbi:MAG: hypothetical protein IID37_04815 [Planctomycetes bacterium]|nr:hypothetical protein [Planctomycetota bacterium]